MCLLNSYIKLCISFMQLFSPGMYNWLTKMCICLFVVWVTSCMVAHITSINRGADHPFNISYFCQRFPLFKFVFQFFNCSQKHVQYSSSTNQWNLVTIQMNKFFWPLLIFIIFSLKFWSFQIMCCNFLYLSRSWEKLKNKYRVFFLTGTPLKS